MFKFIGINKEKEMCLSNKKYTSHTDEKGINIFAKSMVHMHITAELKTYQLSCFRSESESSNRSS